jgi:ubiquinone biosynthesis protein
MNIINIAKTYKKLKRLNQILPVLIKYGFGGVLSELKLDYYFYLSKNIFKFKERKEYESLSNEKRFRLALQELGPTFVKLGQILSTREDILPNSWIEELEKLQDQAEPFPFRKVKSNIEDNFSYINETPIAAASIAQVHYAELKTGEKVVIKIKRPGIDETVATDILLLKQFALLLETYIPEIRIFRPVSLVEEFEDIILKELDFFHELQNIKNFKAIFENDEFVHIPEVYEEFSGKNHIVMEYVEGIKINNLEELKKQGHNLVYITKNWSRKVIEQVLVHGFFHADPHPGNIFVLRNGKLCYLDFGMMGRLTSEMQLYIGKLIIAIASKDVDVIVKVLNKMADDFYVENLTKFKKDLLDFINSYYNVSLKNFDIGRVFKELFRILRKYNIKIIVDYVLLDKTILTMEAICKKMDPDFNIFDNAKNIVKEVLKKEKSFSKLKKETYKKLENINELIEDIPQNFSELLKKVLKNHLEVKFYHKGLDDFIREMDKATNRLVFGLIISSTIIASSIIVKTGIGPTVRGVSILGISGFLFAFVLGIWLIYGILKSGRL